MRLMTKCDRNIYVSVFTYLKFPDINRLESNCSGKKTKFPIIKSNNFTIYEFKTLAKKYIIKTLFLNDIYI